MFFVQVHLVVSYDEPPAFAAFGIIVQMFGTGFRDICGLIKSVLNGNWLASSSLTHHCKATGCCRDRGHTIERVTAILLATIFRSLPQIPISGRWMQCFECALGLVRRAKICTACVVCLFDFRVE
jgi:hypothetical protein